MPHHYHLRIQSAIFWITFLGIVRFAQPPASAQQLRRIYYGTSASVSHLPVWVAKDAGLFAKKGLNVEPVQIRGGALITLGITDGQLQSPAERSR